MVAALLFLEGKSGSFSCCFLVGKGGSCPVISGRELLQLSCYCFCLVNVKSVLLFWGSKCGSCHVVSVW